MSGINSRNCSNIQGKIISPVKAKALPGAQARAGYSPLTRSAAQLLALPSQ
ncbi:hypothetical protein D3C75_1222970 [compost metagenome]